MKHSLYRVMNCAIQLVPCEHGVWIVPVFVKRAYLCLELDFLYSTSGSFFILWEDIGCIAMYCYGNDRLMLSRRSRSSQFL